MVSYERTPSGKAMALGPEGQLLRTSAWSQPPKTKGISCTPFSHLIDESFPQVCARGTAILETAVFHYSIER